MIKLALIFFLVLNTITVQSMEFSVGAQARAPMPMIVGVLGNPVPELDKLVKHLISDLEFSKQIKVQLIKIKDDVLKKHTLQELAKNYTPLAIFISPVAGGIDQFEWRLYDLLDQKMLIGKKVAYQGSTDQAAHVVANKVWQNLMGCDSSFNSVIVACQKLKSNQKNRQHIYAFHPTKGTSGKVPLVTAPTINIAPRWHPTKRLLYFSQHTPKNVRLMSLEEHGRQRVVTDFDGLNLTPAISPQGQIVVSLSSGGCEKLYRYERGTKHKSSKFVALTDCRMHAISPSFIDEDRVVFCAIDSAHKIPRITILNLPERSATFLTGRAFCVSPVYSAVKNKIAYCKRVNGIQQIFCYDLKNQEHEQLTNNSGDKDECSWSPCGNYLVFTEDHGKESQIALLNLLDRSIKYLSPKGESWCFPAWSPCYDERLFVKC